MFYILNELVFNGESSPDEVRQRIRDRESKHNDYYQQFLTEKIDVRIEKMWDKIVKTTTLQFQEFSYKTFFFSENPKLKNVFFSSEPTLISRKINFIKFRIFRKIKFCG